MHQRCVLNRANLALENAALRQQLAIYQRAQKRVRFRTENRAFWVVLRKLWSGWERALAGGRTPRWDFTPHFPIACSNRWGIPGWERNLNFSNRRMRTRLSGGVGGERRANRRPLSRSDLSPSSAGPMSAEIALDPAPEKATLKCACGS